jgi:hypothetical protein
MRQHRVSVVQYPFLCAWVAKLWSSLAGVEALGKEQSARAAAKPSAPGNCVSVCRAAYIGWMLVLFGTVAV